MSPTDATRGTTGPTGAPRRVFLSHTSDLGRPDQPGSFVAAGVAAGHRSRLAVTDTAYFAAHQTSPAASSVELVAGEPSHWLIVAGPLAVDRRAAGLS